MTRENVSMFVMSNQSNFDSSKMPAITQQLERMDDSQLVSVSSAGYKSPTVALILSLFLGGLGIDRFYVGDTGLGVLKLLTCGCLGIMTIIDWFLIMGKAREKNFNIFMQAASFAPQAAPVNYPPQNPGNYQ